MAAGDGKKMHGKFGAVYLFAAKGETGAKKVATLTDWELNLGRDFVDATVFGNTNKTYLPGLKDVSGSARGIFDTSGDIMVNAADAEEVPIFLYGRDTTAGLDDLLIAYGKGFIDGTISNSNTDAIRTSFNFRAADNWAVYNGTELEPPPPTP